MTDTTLPCPTCGALLVTLRRDTDATGEAVWFWLCENGHHWQQSAAFGWLPIDPEHVPAEAVTIELETV